ncbi:phosphatase PAP2 family protein [Andreprevotia chitinilytica]|uniref:phosphatase PAP2 family protein n=1 Tax=Andreprevotia chitinilytica TaxID=396808 RepID=UPI00068FC00F|nr:phosphatase PAP2 family protein [Andreprevotia chitinilytica]
MRRKTYWLAAGGLLVFLLVWLSLGDHVQTRFDASLSAWLYDRPLLVQASQLLGWAGNVYGSLTIALGIGWLARKQGRIAWPGLPGLVFASWCVNGALKRLVNRPRPDLEHLMAVHGPSFPSGHAMAAMTLYGALGYLACRHWPSRRGLVFPLTLLAILAGGMARLVLGVHYGSDVLAGYAVGCVLLAVYLQTATYSA